MQDRPDAAKIKEVFQTGGVFAYPTEAVWGLGCDPFNAEAVNRLLDIKSRHHAKGLILITGDIKHVDQLLSYLPLPLQEKARTYWPGHTTLLIPDYAGIIPEVIRGEHLSVAVRVSQHPFIQWFSREVSPLLVSTSANKAGGPACRSMTEVQKKLGQILDYIAPGDTLGHESPSRIIDLESGRIIR